MDFVEDADDSRVRSDPLAQVTGVELVPEVIEMLPHFEAVNAGLATDPRVNRIPQEIEVPRRASQGLEEQVPRLALARRRGEETFSSSR